MRRSARDSRVCPVCGTPHAHPILYGFPPAGAFEDPEIVIGGCVISPDSPAYHCRNARCGTEFGSLGVG